MAQNPYQSPETAPVEPEVPPDPQFAVIEAIPFRTFLWLSAGMGFSFGLMIGVCALLVSIFGGHQAEFGIDLPDGMGGGTVEGWKAGLCLLVIAPCYFCIILAILSIPTYLPFSFLWKLLRKRKLVVQGSIRSP